MERGDWSMQTSTPYLKEYLFPCLCHFVLRFCACCKTYSNACVNAGETTLPLDVPCTTNPTPALWTTAAPPNEPLSTAAWPAPSPTGPCVIDPGLQTQGPYLYDGTPRKHILRSRFLQRLMCCWYSHLRRLSPVERCGISGGWGDTTRTTPSSFSWLSPGFLFR